MSCFRFVHGPYGEDGTLQGLLELANVPYVGAGVLASAVGMDKAVAKTLFAAAGLPIVDYAVVAASQWDTDRDTTVDELRRRFALSALRQARQSRIERRHLEGPKPASAGAGNRPGAPVRPEDHRGSLGTRGP